MNTQDLSASRRRVLRACEQVFDDCLQLTQDLVAQYPVLHQEEGALKVLEQRLRDLDLEPERVPLTPHLDHPLHAPTPWDTQGKTNLVTELNAGAAGRKLVFNGHIDVVPAEPWDMWRRAPNVSVIDGEWLYGRGAGDMLSGVAAMVFAVHAVQRAGLRIRSPLSIQAVVEEECSGNGALAMLHAGHNGDFVLIPEPFGPTLLGGQIGVIWLTVRIDGRPAHVLDTSAGLNAIEALNAPMDALRELEERLNQHFNTVGPYRDMAHPYNLNIGEIQGGNWPSSVAASASFSARLGFPPDMSVATIMQLIQDALAPWQARLHGEGQARMTLRFNGFRSEGHLVDLAHPGIRLLADCHQQLVGQAPEPYYATCTTDLRAFHHYSNTAGTCYGPIARHIHGVDESVHIESIRQVLHTYAWFITRWCDVEPA